MEFHLTGRISRCLLLAYRTPAMSVKGMLPTGLCLVTQGPWAFWNIVACCVERIRPLGLSPLCGITYHHVAYRLYVRAQLADGSERDGLYFVRSDADSWMISRTGNWLTDFRFHFSRIELGDGPNPSLQVKSGDGCGDASLLARTTPDFALLANSCFSSLKQRERILKYKPEALSIDPTSQPLKIASVHRDEKRWSAEPLEIETNRWPYLESIGQNDYVLERATRVAPIDYQWSLGARKRLLVPG